MDELYYAFVELMEAKNSRDKAHDAYEGYSWGYHGYEYENNISKAKERFHAGFKDAIKEVLKEIAEENTSH